MMSRVPTAMRASVIAIVALAVAAPAAGANGQTVVPPGNSGANQYVESIPTSGGGQPANNVHPGGGGGKGAVAASTQIALAAQGHDGAQTIALARATAPSGVHGLPATRHSTGRRTKPGAGTQTPAGNAAVTGTPASTSSSSLVSQVLKALSGSSSQGGLGIMLPLILVVTLVGAAIFAITHRRRRAT